MTKSDPRWEIRKFPKRKEVKRKIRKEIEICRVVPIRLAQMPNIYDWLEAQRKTRLSIMITKELDLAYRSLSEFMHEEIDPSYFENRIC